MSRNTASKQQHRPKMGSHWPRPSEIRQRAQRIRQEWSDRELGEREMLAKRRLRALAEQLLHSSQPAR